MFVSWLHYESPWSGRAERAAFDFQGVGSVNQVSLFFENIGLTVGVIPRFVGTVAFSTALDQSSYGLLGQSGFFSRFKVEFDLPNGFFYIEG